jgi:Tfp pilus assembly protein PilO
MKSSARPIVAGAILLAAALAFWTLALSPKRTEADELGAKIETLNANIETAQTQLIGATAAKRAFPTAYHQLVELGQAVPATDETPSLLVELSRLAAESGVDFNSIQLEERGGETGEVPASTSTESGEAEALPASEVAASLLPLGASIGPAGLGVMPYTLQFEGNFFDIAKFVGKVNALVRSKGKTGLTIDGRLVTINSFSLKHQTGSPGEKGKKKAAASPTLEASFSVTTFLTPPGQGVTAGATPTAPAEATATTVAAEE